MPVTPAAPFHFDNSYARQLQGLYAPVQPAHAPQPRALFVNTALADELGLALPPAADWPDLFSGNRLPAGAEPIAQAYAGHQFGGFSPSLGDGRALLLGEVIDTHGQRRDIAFKGSGRTPYSRGGDGLAAVGPMLREVLLGEALHALGIPTTRALAVAATGAWVQRDTALPGAVLTRVAASHLRVGTFQYLAARDDTDTLRRLVAYAVHRHVPGAASASAAAEAEPDAVLHLLRHVGDAQARLLAQWLNVGFIHGVMNTDNMTISGETIDFGPCAFLEAYDPATVFSSIDRNGRYAYANQPLIARWNLARMAEALLPLLHPDPDTAVALATEVIDAFPAQHAAALLQGQRAKLGLAMAQTSDVSLAADWLALLQQQQVDFTLAWRHLADAREGQPARLQALFTDPAPLAPWLARWAGRCAAEESAPGEAAAAMRRVSPWVIARNHRVEEALTAASDDGNLAPFEALLAALRQPFDELPGHARFAEPAPVAVTACYRTFCGT